MHLIWLTLESYVVAFTFVCMLTSSIIAIFPSFSVYFPFDDAFENIFIFVTQWKFSPVHTIDKTLTILIVSWYVWNISGYQFSVFNLAFRKWNDIESFYKMNFQETVSLQNENYHLRTNSIFNSIFGFTQKQKILHIQSETDAIKLNTSKLEYNIILVSEWSSKLTHLTSINVKPKTMHHSRHWCKNPYKNWNHSPSALHSYIKIGFPKLSLSFRISEWLNSLG